MKVLALCGRTLRDGRWAFGAFLVAIALTTFCYFTNYNLGLGRFIAEFLGCPPWYDPETTCFPCYAGLDLGLMLWSVVLVGICLLLIAGFLVRRILLK